MNAKNVRIKDIAQLSGVSVGTVDRVLHNRGRVSEEALKKVLTVLDQIEYKPNVIARTLGSNKTYTIEARDTHQSASWMKISDLVAVPTNRVAVVTNNITSGSRFYRLVTPRIP